MKRLLPYVLLVTLCLSASLWLESWARPYLIRQQHLAEQQRYLDLLPPNSFDNQPLVDTLPLPAGGLLGNAQPESALRARLDGVVVAVLLPVTVSGYEGPIQQLVAVSRNGSILASKVLSQRETPGLANLDAPLRQHWGQRLAGLAFEDDWRLRTEGGPFDQISGATRTSASVRDGLRNAVQFFNQHRQALLEDAP